MKTLIVDSLCMMFHILSTCFLVTSFSMTSWLVQSDAESWKLYIGLWSVCFEGTCKSIFHTDYKVLTKLGGWYRICQGFAVCGLLFLSCSVLLGFVWYLRKNVIMVKSILLLLFGTLISHILLLTVFTTESAHNNMISDTRFTDGVAVTLDIVGTCFCVISMATYYYAFRDHRRLNASGYVMIT